MVATRVLAFSTIPAPPRPWSCDSPLAVVATEPNLGHE
jgi:hypothetical protein